jgi:hypothetical protein
VTRSQEIGASREQQLEDALRDLERAASALLAHELHPCAAPKFRDINVQIGNARKILGEQS